ncbi:hypothetical protein CGRA01v4_09912 [Colletotrichum graminicola]|nr:hypothetical protein CGRA01v4_09912 [Colletotrichum graminicola]
MDGLDLVLNVRLEKPHWPPRFDINHEVPGQGSPKVTQQSAS